MIGKGFAGKAVKKNSSYTPKKSWDTSEIIKSEASGVREKGMWVVNPVHLNGECWHSQQLEQCKYVWAGFFTPDKM